MLTYALALAIGGYALAAGIGVLLDPERFLAMLEGLRERAAAAYVTGVCTYFLGCGILIAHPRWETWLQTVVTFVGGLAVAEGTAFLLSPRGTVSVMRRFWHRGSMRYWGGFAACFGILMITAGCSGLVLAQPPV